jgi:hypothetical protein
MSTTGKNKLKNTACGLRNIPVKLAFVIANIALNWLYGCGIH